MLTLPFRELKSLKYECNPICVRSQLKVAKLRPSVCQVPLTHRPFIETFEVLNRFFKIRQELADTFHVSQGAKYILG